MATFRPAVRLHCLVSRKLINSACAKELRAVSTCATTNYIKGTSLFKLNYSVTGSRPMLNRRSFSKQPEETQEISSDSVQPSPNEVAESTETIEVPDGLTEREVLEVCRGAQRDAFSRARLARLSEEETKVLKIIKLMLDVKRSTGENVPKPENMHDWRWLYLLLYRGSDRMVAKTLDRWFKFDWTQENELRKKQEKVQPVRDIDWGQDLHNKITRRIDNKAMNSHYFNNLAHAMQFGQPLIFDFSFANKMSSREMLRTAQQFKGSFGINKILPEPFHIILAGMPTEGKFPHVVERHLSTVIRPDIPMTVTNKDVFDLGIEKERLVYLTPDAPQVLKKFEYDDVYIIGGIVDPRGMEPLTYAKAKEFGIRCVKFPLDRYILFQGKKVLTLNQVVGILGDLKHGLNMGKAMKHVPTRKIQRMINHDNDFVFVQNRF